MGSIESQILQMLIDRFGNRPLLTHEVADIYRKTPQAFAVWRCRGKGPPSIDLDGNKRAHLPQDVAADLAARRRSRAAA